MPIKKVRKQGIIGYQWGNSGTWYSTKEFGVHEAYVLARRQGIAIKISQVRTHARKTKHKTTIVRKHWRKKLRK